MTGLLADQLVAVEKAKALLEAVGLDLSALADNKALLPATLVYYNIAVA